MWRGVLSRANQPVVGTGANSHIAFTGRICEYPNMDLGLDIRELELTDRAEASQLQSTGAKAIGVKRLRERHHALARLLAQGVKPGEAALIAGYCPSRVSILQRDPAFQELLTHYRSQMNLAAIDLGTRLGHLGSTAIEELQERLEEAPETFTNRELMEASELAADRTGYGPQSTTKNLNVNVNLAQRLEAARKRAGDAPPLPAPKAVS